ncbi:sulfonate ABC transporter substrate-binding protein [Undibacterium sp. RuRC25W]|uniref:sulfonate ABC transporter substrate-binding protein n=1 Tax=Undibacterium sp. RuRC25W TaxID=3413047 RepID=UPI003BF107F3
MERHRQTRRHTIAILSAMLASGLASVAAPGFTQNKVSSTLRIGYQKYGPLTILKGTGALEKRLVPLGVDVKWTEFTAGPQLLEGLNVGSIDFGTTGEAPPIFAQAAGADLVYVANEPAAPGGEAIIVPKTSTLKSVADLKGKKIVLNKGSNVHYLLVKVLEKAGIAYRDVETIFLPPADARAAFERGSADAWVIWDPFLAAAEKQLGARILADGKGTVSNHQFYLAARPYAQKHPEVLKALLDELARADEWILQNVKQTTTIFSSQTGLPTDVVELSNGRFSFHVQPISEQVIREQQSIADTFADLKLIPKKIQIKDAVFDIKSSTK